MKLYLFLSFLEKELRILCPKTGLDSLTIGLF